MTSFNAYYIRLNSTQDIYDSKFNPNLSYKPYIFLDIIESTNLEKFVATIGNSEGYHTSSGIRNFEYYDDYIKGAIGAFTFDKKIFYKPVEFRSTTNDKVVVVLEKIEKEESNKVTKRTKPPPKVKALLQKEINSKCPFCSIEDVDHFEVHHIDSIQ